MHFYTLFLIIAHSYWPVTSTLSTWSQPTLSSPLLYNLSAFALNNLSTQVSAPLWLILTHRKHSDDWSPTAKSFSSLCIPCVSSFVSPSSATHAATYPQFQHGLGRLKRYWTMESHTLWRSAFCHLTDPAPEFLSRTKPFSLAKQSVIHWKSLVSMRFEKSVSKDQVRYWDPRLRLVSGRSSLFQIGRSFWNGKASRRVWSF